MYVVCWSAAAAIYYQVLIVYQVHVWCITLQNMGARRLLRWDGRCSCFVFGAGLSISCARRRKINNELYFFIAVPPFFSIYIYIYIYT